MFSTATKTAANVTAASAEHDIRSQGRDAVHTVQDAVKDAYDHATGYAEDAREKVRHFADSARSEVKHAADRATSQVRAYPLPSALAMLGVGVVLGLLLSGSRR